MGGEKEVQPKYGPESKNYAFFEVVEASEAVSDEVLCRIIDIYLAVKTRRTKRPQPSSCLKTHILFLPTKSTILQYLIYFVVSHDLGKSALLIEIDFPDRWIDRIRESSFVVRSKESSLFPSSGSRPSTLNPCPHIVPITSYFNVCTNCINANFP